MLLIEKGFMIDPKSGTEGMLDILTEGERIKRIGENLRSVLPQETLRSCRVLDAAGCLVLPGLVDVHVHFREPGFTEKEDITTGAAAAAAGGFTTVVLMANTKPAVDNEETLRYVLERGRTTGIRVETCANVTVGLAGKQLTNMSQLAQAGAIGFTDDGIPLMDPALAEAAMVNAARLDMPISFHEEDPSLIENNGINRGRASAHFGIGGSPREAEISLVKRDLELALRTGAVINIQHISTREAVELVRQARKRGGRIHAEATPHHFSLTEEAVISYGSLAKMNPPLREEEDRRAILEGLRDGVIDIIATDHAPHTSQEKVRGLTEAPSGIIGLETALPLGITELVETGVLTMRQLAERMAWAPAQLYRLDAGYLQEGGPADITIVDPEARKPSGPYASKSSNTPFAGWILKGVVRSTICRGKVCYGRGAGAGPADTAGSL